MDLKKKKPLRNFSPIPLMGYRFLIFLVQTFILVACIQYAQIIYRNDILPDKMVKDTFLQTACTVVAKKLSETGRLVHRYRADFLISYTINNIPHRTWVTGNGLDQDYFHARKLQEATLSQYEIGTSYSCWYNPQAPQMAVLVLRHNWISTLPLALPTLIGLIALYYVIKGLLQFLGGLFNLLSSKTRFKK